MATDKVIELNLDNGLKVFLIHDDTTSLASIRTYVRAGSINEEGYGLGGGLSHYLEHIVAGGSTTVRSEKDYTKLVSKLGGAFNAYTTFDHTSYYINTTSQYITTAIDVIYEWMFSCEFKKSEFDRERDVIIKEIEKNNASISNQFFYLSHTNFYKMHPIQFPVIGYLENFKAITRKNLKDYYKANYIASNMILVIGGNFDPEVVKEDIQQTFGKQKELRKPLSPYFSEPKPFSNRFLEKEAETNVTFYSMKFATVDIVSDDLYPLDLLEFILANGRDSILYKTLVEEEKLAYSIRCSSYTPSVTTGYFEFYLEIDHHNLEKVKKRIKEILRDIGHGKLEDRRLNRARKQKLSEDIFSIVSIEDKVSRIGQAYMYGYTQSFFDDYVRLFNRVKRQDVVRVVKEYFDFERVVETVMIPKIKQTMTNPQSSKDQSPRVKLPKKVILDNGIRVLLFHDNSLPRVYTKAFVSGGIRAETSANNGIGGLIADMLSKDSYRYNKQTIKNLIEDRGASLGGNLGNNTLYYNLDCLAEDFSTLLPVFSHSFLKPKFVQLDLMESKRQLNKVIEKRKDSWSNYGFYYFKKHFFSDHPYSLSLNGEIASLEQIDVKDIQTFYERLLNPEEMVITVFGDFDESFVLSSLKRDFGSLKKSEHAYNPKMDLVRPLHKNQSSKTVTIDQKVSAVFVGFDGISLSNTDDLLKIELLDGVLSGMNYPGGRLHSILRGKGSVYLVHGVNFFGLEDGYFLIYALTSQDKEEVVKKVIFEQIESLKTKKVDETEFELAKAQLIYYNKERLSSLEDYSVIVATDELYGRGFDFSINLLDKIVHLKPEDVQKMAQKYFNFPQTYLFKH